MPNRTIQLDEQSVASYIEDVSKAFRDLLGRASHSAKPNLGSFEDAHVRFNIWKSNIVGSTSIDYKLRNSNRLRKKIGDDINDLKLLITQATDLASNEQTAPEEKDSPDDESKKPPYINPSASSSPSPSEETSEIEGIAMEITSIIDGLFRIAHLITTDTTDSHSRVEPEASMAHFSRYDAQHVVEKFPKASEYLTQRLGAAITRRRQYFKYRSLHAEKLSALVGTSAAEIPHPESRDGVMTNSNMNPNMESDGMDSSVTTSKLDYEYDTPDSLRPNVSEAFSRANMLDEPSEIGTGDVFECPYCHFMMKVRNGIAWR